MVFDKYKVRSMNENLVLKELITSQPVSRALLAKKTNLNKATITEIISTLIDRKLVNEIGLGKSKEAGGRKPILLELNRNAGIALAFDLGNNYLNAIATDLNGEVIESFNQKNLVVSSENIVSLIQSGVNKFKKLAKNKVYGIVGLTAAVHGVVFENHVTLSPNYNMMGAHLYDKLTNLFEFPIYMENEANLAAIAHISYATQLNDIAVLSIHTGIGAGIIVNRELHTGTNGSAGELGHMIIQPNGLDCRCGRKGCFEQYCSTQHIINMYQSITNKKFKSLMEIKESYNNNKEVAKLIDDTCFYLAIGINNLISAYDPEVVFIISELAVIIPNMVLETKKILEKNFNRKINIYISHPEFNATLKGAAITAINNFFSVNNLKLKSDSVKQYLEI
ncbi:MAG: ROK family protein [Anaerorhabdus sp.]